jgi:hypothetical protein
MSSALGALGVPSTTGAAGYLPDQGLFHVPTGIQRIYEWGLYSSYRFTAGTTLGTLGTPRLFQLSQQQTGQGYTSSALSISETNMIVGAIAPGDDSYQVSAISCEIYGATNVAPLPGDIRLFQRVGVLYWTFGNTLQLPISPISMIGSASGIFGATADTGTPVTFANNGNGSTMWSYQRVVVAIPATQSFGMQIQLGSAGQPGTLAPTAETQLRVTLFNQARSAVAVA